LPQIDIHYTKLDHEVCGEYGNISTR